MVSFIWSIAGRVTRRVPRVGREAMRDRNQIFQVTLVSAKPAGSGSNTEFFF